MKENAEYERLRQASAREFLPIARAVDKLYNSLGCNEMIPVSLFILVEHKIAI